MHDFDYDVMQKKRIARNAKYQKNGSKSKKCTLPSDYLTAKERKALNGEVKTYCLSKPMKWDEFKAMPLNIQEEYILKLYEKYHVNMTDLGYLFARHARTIRAHFAENNLCEGLFKKGGDTRSSERLEHRKKFKKWCEGVVEVSQKEEKPEKREVKHTNINAPKHYIFPEAETKKAPVVTSVGLTFEGPVSVEDLSKTLLEVLKNHAVGRECARFVCQIEFVSNS